MKNKSDTSDKYLRLTKTSKRAKVLIFAFIFIWLIMTGVFAEFGEYGESDLIMMQSEQSEHFEQPIPQIAYIPLANGWFAEDLGGNLFMIYDASVLPIGYIQLSGNDSIETFDVINKFIPFDSFTFFSPANPAVPAPRNKNPDTSDNEFTCLLLAGFLSFCGAVLKVSKKYLNN